MAASVAAALPEVHAARSDETRCVTGEKAVTRGSEVICVPVTAGARSCPNGAYVGKDGDGNDVCRASETTTICVDSDGIDDYDGKCRPYMQNDVVLDAGQYRIRKMMLNSPYDVDTGTPPAAGLTRLPNSKSSPTSTSGADYPLHMAILGTVLNYLTANITFVIFMIMITIGIASLIKRGRRRAGRTAGRNVLSGSAARATGAYSKGRNAAGMQYGRNAGRHSPAWARNKRKMAAGSNGQGGGRTGATKIEQMECIILPDTNVCIDYHDLNRGAGSAERVDSAVKFFNTDTRYFLLDKVYKECIDHIEANNAMMRLDRHPKSVKNLDRIKVKNQEYTSELKYLWEHRVLRMFQMIQSDISMDAVKQMKRWQAVKGDGSLADDIRILAQAAYMADHSDMPVVFLTNDHDFIVFAPQIRENFKVMVLSGYWYRKRIAVSDTDPIGFLMDMGTVEMLVEYDVLDPRTMEPKIPKKNETDRILRSDDPYVIFGLSKDVSPDGIKARYRDLAKRHDPSRGRINMSKAEKARADRVMAKINNAFLQLQSMHGGRKA